MAYWNKINEENAKRAAVFKDTVVFFEDNKILAGAIKNSIDKTKFYPADTEYNLTNGSEDGQVIVCDSDSFTYAVLAKTQRPECRVAVLNFASATHPGGGVVRGSRAQEESLCRTSTLYPVINTEKLKDLYYGPNKKDKGAAKALHTDAVIYSPDIVVCKTTDSNPVRLEESQFTFVDVITCAAPNLREKPSNSYNPGDGDAVSITNEELYRLHISRAKHIIGAAAENGVDILVLGAFGCGAFKNDPKTVATAYRDVLAECKGLFKAVVFPIPGGRNLTIFKSVLSPSL